MSRKFSFQTTMNLPYQEALEQVIKALKNEGFGVLTEIDVKSTLKEKLDVDFDKYAILGACNPPLAHKALSTDPMVGLMLPCNVTVHELEGQTRVSIINPLTMLSMDVLNGSEAIFEVAEDAADRLKRVVDVLGKI